MLDALEKYGVMSRTKIMYHAMLSNDQNKSYILFLLEKGFVTNSTDEHKHQPPFLVITKKGRELLNVIREMNKLVSYRDDIPLPDYAVEKPVTIRKWTEPTPGTWGTPAKVHTPAIIHEKVNLSREEGVPKPGKELMETAELLKDKVRERKNVKTLWENGMRSDRRMAKELGLTRGVVYNHLRGLGMKPNKKLKKG
jgi:predicted transcriptional regulator